MDFQAILLIDSLGIYNLVGLQNPIVILQQSPKVNLERLIAQLKPKQIGLGLRKLQLLRLHIVFPI